MVATQFIFAVLPMLFSMGFAVPVADPVAVPGPSPVAVAAPVPTYGSQMSGVEYTGSSTSHGGQQGVREPS
jgi:hypothetical protein